MYINRLIDNDLELWAKEFKHKPIFLRGARQVGKSTSVRKLAEKFEFFVEVNFEKRKAVHSLFQNDLEPKTICEELSVMYDTPIIAGKTLVFFDEIQSCLPAISSLRFFYEDYPELHLIAAGSLLEFALEELPSFGVGRIRSMFMYPLSFAEFLNACGHNLLLAAIQKSSPAKPLFQGIHSKAVNLLKRFLIIGGMPEVVVKYVEKKEITSCQTVLDDLLNSLKKDFSKYRKRVPDLRLKEVFESAARQVGGKFNYSKIDSDSNHRQLKEALELLKMAGLVISVMHTSGTGIPLGAGINPSKQKMLILDTGILQRLSGLNLAEILLEDDFSLVNKGGIAENFAGLELLKTASCFTEQQLYFWQREKMNAHAEVDFLIQQGDKIVPIEIKSGTSGKMQSLHLFLKEKNINRGVRCSLENFAHYDNIDVYPLYAISNIIQN